jgi:hypothetical protein
MSALVFRSDMHLDVPLSVLDVTLPVDRQALMAFLLDPESVCTVTSSCTAVVYARHLRFLDRHWSRCVHCPIAC